VQHARPGADAGQLVDLVRREHVDVLALQEYTPAAEAALRAAGLSELLPYRAADAQPGATGSALYARLPIRQSRPRTLPWGFGQMTATLDIPGGQPLTVESVHPCAPASREATRAWSDGLASQPAAGPDALRVLIGDFNATLDHSQLRRLLTTGYRDAASTVGAGLVPTWPYAGARAHVTPRVTLDHALADERIAVTGYAVFTIAGTDHRPIFAELLVPAGADR
jgi:endonuclease/exonuclease/phosphatase family metal-dependent hydrolase